jgi:radical SAM superfamily enzyme YgiQ (UPF0313 family)
MRKKLLFIVPMHITWESFTSPQYYNVQIKKADGKVYNLPRGDLPLGPLSMSAYLKQHIDVEVKLIDFNAEVNALSNVPFNSFAELVLHFFEQHKVFGPDYIGISSLFSPSYDNFMDCGRIARQIWPESIIVGGGNIPTNSYKTIYEEDDGDFFDALCYGEGEKPMLELMQANHASSYLETSNSWITRNRITKDVAFSPQHNFIDNLDEIPFFDYALCDLAKHQVNQVIDSYHNLEPTRAFHIMTSRGCPFLCTFCASHKTHGRTMRYHSLQRVEDDLARLAHDFGAETVVFQDDHLMSDPKRVKSILTIVKNLNLNSIYQNGLTLYALDRPMLQAFYEAGVRHLVLPVESGSEEVLKFQMRKPLKLKISERVAKDCRDLGIYTNTGIMIGMPGETVANLEDSRANLKRVVSNWFNVSCASPIVGSDMHGYALEKGYLKSGTLGSDFRVAVIETDDFTPNFIQDYQYFMNLDLNFVNNSDIRLESWSWARHGFENVLRIKHDHAFAHYYLTIVCDALGDSEKKYYHWMRYIELTKDEFWVRWIYIFNLPGIDRAMYNDELYGLLEPVLKGTYSKTNMTQNYIPITSQ